MLFRDRRATFKSPQVEALAKASAAGARGIKAMPNAKKNNPYDLSGAIDRASVSSQARDILRDDRTEPDRGEAYQRAAAVIEHREKDM